MRHRVIKKLGASLMLASCISCLYAGDLPIQADSENEFPFPILEEQNASDEQRFPYLPALETPKTQWPALFQTPITPSQSLPARDLDAQFSQMDALPAPPVIAIIIDDVGYNRRGMEETLALPLPVVLAILPQTPYAKKAAHKAYLQQRVTILHAPMENERALKLGPGGLYAAMDELEFKQTLRADLDSVPHVRGANNHMGSLLTTQLDHMTWVMDVMAERNLFFIDSLTNAQSVAYQTAKARGIKTLTRDVFLDNVRSSEAINKQFDRLLEKAHKYGRAVAIGHPYPETTAYLKQRLAQPLSAQLVGLEGLLE